MEIYTRVVNKLNVSNYINVFFFLISYFVYQFYILHIVNLS